MMTTKDQATSESPADAGLGHENDDQFVGRMFSGFGHVSEIRPAPAQRPPEAPYHPLPESKARPGVTYCLQSRTSELRVHAHSPATDVMTDLSRVVAVTIGPGASIDEAHQVMVGHAVRALFVVDDAKIILGIVTANDLLGEKPVQIAQSRAVRHVDVLVSEVMTPASLLEAMELQDVLQVRVGDVVETLKRSGRQHALVIESGAADATSSTRKVRGMFSLTQIARQLGLPPDLGRGVAHTFAEIEAAIRS